MKSFRHTTSVLSLSSLLVLVNAQANGIDQRDMIEELEHILVDNTGTNSDGFVGAVTPCLNYVSANASENAAIQGQQSSAQWVRVAFHDFVTADIEAGTGGIDASLGWESERPENAGLFVNDTLQFFSPTVSAYLSMADNIALGVVVSVYECDSTNTGIPIRVGRIDADAAGPAGVPQPFTDLDTTFAQFAASGFNETDTIALTACGHTLGRVHYTTFPDIVPESAVTATNVDGGVPFGSTPGVFDTDVINEYLDQTGSLGGPLVTTSNVTDRSDLRLYTWDNNATVQALSEAAAFETKCKSLFERMINVIPSTVTLSEPVTPMTWKGVNLVMDISSSGIVSISGLIRNLYDAATTTPPNTVSYTTTSTSGNSSVLASDATTGNGTSLYGNTTYWPFNTTLASLGTTSLNINDAISYPINDNIFVLPAQSSVNSTSLTISLRAAALTSLVSSSTSETMTGVLYVPVAQIGTATKKITNTTVEMASLGTAGNYTLFGGTAVLSNVHSVIAKVVLGDLASGTVKTKIFVDGV